MAATRPNPHVARNRSDSGRTLGAWVWSTRDDVIARRAERSSRGHPTRKRDFFIERKKARTDLTLRFRTIGTRRDAFSTGKRRARHFDAATDIDNQIAVGVALYVEMSERFRRGASYHAALLVESTPVTGANITRSLASYRTPEVRAHSG
jgi:hypothetical protein